MSAMASEITGATIAYPFVPAQIKENIKARRHWAVLVVNGEFNSQSSSNVEFVSI